MSKQNFEYRPLDRSGFCRGCGRTVLKNDEKVFVRYHWRNKDTVILCQDCVKEMASEMNKETN